MIAAIDTERDMLSNRRVDVDAAKLRYTSVNTAEEMKVGSGSGEKTVLFNFKNYMFDCGLTIYNLVLN